MRIAVWHNLPSGGGQRALFDHVEGLMSRGHDVEIWSPPIEDTSLFDFSKLAPHHSVALARPPIGRLSRIPHIAGQFLGFYIQAMDEHCRLVATQIDQGKFDILLSGTCRQFGAPRIGRFISIPSILYLQEPHRRLYEAPNISGLRHRAASPGDLLRSGVNFFDIQRSRQQVREEIDNAAAFDCLLVNSRFSAESIMRAYGIPTRICYLGVRPELWKLGRTTPNRTVVSIGTLAPHKRVHFLLSALANTSNPHPSLQWIGNSCHERYMRQVTEQAANLGLDFRVNLAVSHESMLSVLRNASLLAYAPRLEPFGYAPLECAAAGLPTVAVAEGGVRETVIDGLTGVLVQDDPYEMGTAINELLENPARIRELGHAAQRSVRAHWTIDHAIDRLEGELHRCIRVAKR